MKWITKHIYVDQHTGEITNKLKEDVIITKKTTKHYVQNSIGITEVTNYFRKSKWKQIPLEFPTSQ